MFHDCVLILYYSIGEMELARIEEEKKGLGKHGKLPFSRSFFFKDNVWRYNYESSDVEVPKQIFSEAINICSEPLCWRFS